jgi:two-component system response regulator YesN
MRRSGRRTLLVIDDEKPFCDAVRDYLESDRIEVLSAQSRKEGIEICAKRKIDVVLLDQKLPDGNGHDLAKQILEKHPRARIIFITAFPTFDTAEAAARLDTHEFLIKPIDPEELKNMVENTMRVLDLEQRK